MVANRQRKMTLVKRTLLKNINSRDLCSRAPRRTATRDFAVVLMLSAVIGVACQVLEVVVESGRSTGWWK